MANNNVDKRIKDIEKKTMYKTNRPIVIIREGEPVPEGAQIVIVDTITGKSEYNQKD